MHARVHSRVRINHLLLKYLSFSVWVMNNYKSFRIEYELLYLEYKIDKCCLCTDSGIVDSAGAHLIQTQNKTFPPPFDVWIRFVVAKAKANSQTHIVCVNAQRNRLTTLS